MAQISSYTEEDIKTAEDYLEKHPKAQYWQTMDGLRIPFHMIKDDHLKNIRKYLQIHGKHYHPKVIAKMDKLWKQRFASTPAGKVLYGES